MSLGNEINALNHLIEVLDGNNSFFDTFKLSKSDINMIFRDSNFSNVDGLSLLGLLYRLTSLVNHDSRFNKLVCGIMDQEHQLFLYDAHPSEPSLIIETYIKNVIDTLKEYPEIFKLYADEKVRGDHQIDNVSSINSAHLNFDDHDTKSYISPQRRPSSFTKRLSSKLKRTSTKSSMSIQSSIMSLDTVQTSATSVGGNSSKTVVADYEVSMGVSSGISINVESIVKNVIYQFCKMFQNIDKIDSKIGNSHEFKEDVIFLKQMVNQSIVVETYNLLTEYSLRLLHEEMSDISCSMVKV